ncbi:diguanylate cyclase [Azospira restricta]|uniref:Diguanylate cyclase n=1 Tax=Azospira restricta TaxID=404405 RepID=A0A974PXC0_9RHOO|nr:diguanylate cyclase [Azospira restricta]QRJ62974.1 diguanylate cyclase [Azospira restricta]
MHILLLENDPLDATLTSVVLEKAYNRAVRIARVSSLEQALTALRREEADVLFVALQPAALRLQAIRRISHERPATPIIVLVGEGEDESAPEAFAAGAVEFLVKSQITINWIRRAINFAIHRKRMLEDLRATSNHIHNIINLSPDAIVSADARQNIALFNVAAEEMFGYAAKDVLGKPLTLLIPEALRAAHVGHVQRFAEGPAISRRMNERGELQCLRSNGEVFPAEIAISRLQTPDGPIFTAIIRDVTERKRVEAQLLDLAMTDPLTGAANRRHLFEVAELEIKRARRYGRPLSVLALDIDNFKPINDACGHAAGDQVLLRLTVACHEVLREYDMIARIGGDEFVALLPETDERRAQALAQRLVDHIAKIRVRFQGKELQTTISIGCSVVADDDTSIAEAIERADQALLQAKRDGRNRVVTYAQRGQTRAGTPPAAAGTGADKG